MTGARAGGRAHDRLGSMPEIEETLLPGVGVRHEFRSESGDRVSVVTHRGGRREIAMYDRRDPDACTGVIHLSIDETRLLADLLGATHVGETARVVEQEIEGLGIDWVTVPPESTYAGATIGDGAFRTRTGVSIVAVLRDGTTIPAPGPDQVFDAGDVLVAVGTPDGLEQLRSLLAS